MKASALITSGELTFNSIIEIERFMTALRFINSTLTQDEIWFLANESGCGSIEEEDDSNGDEKVKIKYISF